MIFTSMILVFIVSMLLLANHWSQNRGIVYLVALILILSLRQFSLLLFNTTQYVEALSLLVFHTDPLTLLCGPLFFYYLKSLIRGHFYIDRLFLLHLVPAIIISINLYPYFFFPFSSKILFFTAAQHNVASTLPTNLPYLFISLPIQRTIIVLVNLCYVLGVIWQLLNLKYNSNHLKKKVRIIINRILCIIPIVIIPNLIVVIFSTVKSSKNGEIVFRHSSFTADGYLFFIGLILPLSFFFIPSWLYNDRVPSTLLQNLNLKFLRKRNEPSLGFQTPYFEKSDDLKRIISYLENEKPYLNTQFSLHDISRSLNIPHIRVTNCFNKQLQIPFPAYRNKLRIHYATDLFRNGAHIQTSIEGIALMSGFKSKSIFYTAFKAECGYTPIDWIKVNL